MKKLIYIGMMCVFALTAFAQEPEQIDLGLIESFYYSKNFRDISYYEKQILLWEKKVSKNKKDANAWLNYFAATKSANRAEIFQKTKMAFLDSMPTIICKSNFDFQKIAEEAFPNISTTFEGNYMMHFKDISYLKKDYSYLLKANEIKPLDKSILIELLRYYELIQDLPNAEKVAIEVARLKIFSESDYAIAYNILSELDENAVLITDENNDYFPCLILQKLKKIKPNVLITTTKNINPVYTYEYTDKTLAKIGLKSIKAPETSNNKVKKEFTEKVIKETELLEKRNFEQIFKSKYPVYFSNNVIVHFMEEYGENLYLHGLTYRYSEKPINYIHQIQQNFANNYVLDFLKHDFIVEDTLGQTNKLSIYLPSLFSLSKYYKEIGNISLYTETNKLISNIFQRQMADVKFESFDVLIDEEKEYPFIAENLDVKKIDKSFVPLNAAEHIGKFEVTNKEYRLFLNNLKKQKNYDLYVKCMVDTNKWNTAFPNAFNDAMTNLYARHPAYDNYPVVNISYEGAVAYCKWLTVQYNQQHPEGKYVSFRLPTEQEWRYAAGSKNAKALTPFPNDNIYNCDPTITGKKKSKNAMDTTMQCMYLGNIKTDKGYHADGGFHTLKVESYVPNQLGLYTTFGNVAEMTSTKGVIKGGSWADVFEDCTFDKNVTYGDVDPRVGFRIMMEVVPEIEHWYSVKIDKNVYCLKNEEKISNYSTYIENTEKLYGIKSKEYKNALPDTTLWNPENLQILYDNFNIRSKIKTLYDSLKVINLSDSPFKAYSTILDTLTKEQMDNYLKFRSDQVFYSYLTENNYIKYSDDPNNIFTKERYYSGKLDSICLKEKFMYYPVLRLPTENEKQLANAYTTKQLAKSEYTPTNPNSIYSNYVNKTYFDFVKHETKTSPGFYNTYELKPGVKLSDIKPFDLWENYRFVMSWKLWNPNQTK